MADYALSEIYIYPIKSAAGIAVTQASKSGQCKVRHKDKER